MALPGVGFLDVPKRYYPAGPLAPQVLGFVGVDATGLAGLEFEYEDVLAGTPGTRTVELDGDGLPIANGMEVVGPAVAGPDARDDARPRGAVPRAGGAPSRGEGEPRQGRHGRRDGRAVGDVYAMASYPVVRSERLRHADRTAIRNRAVTDMFEPGSVNKVVTAAAALESGAVGSARRLPGAVVDARSAGTP